MSPFSDYTYGDFLNVHRGGSYRNGLLGNIKRPLACLIVNMPTAFFFSVANTTCI